MSSKMATWGDILKRKYNSIIENNETEAMENENESEEEDFLSNSTDDDVYISSEDSSGYDYYSQNHIQDSSAFSSSSFNNIGAGQSIVCQVSPSQNLIRRY